MSKSIFVFDEDGNFLHKIHALGDGPDKYFSIRDASLDVTNKRICLVDLDGRKINFYKYDGEFLESVRMPFLFSSMAFLSEDQFVYWTGVAENSIKEDVDGYSLVVSDLEGNVNHKAFQDRNRNFTYVNPNPMRVSGSDIFYNPRYSNVIYAVDFDGVKPIFEVDLGDSGFPLERLPTITDQEYREMNPSRSFIHKYINLKEGALFTIFGDKKIFTVLYSKKSDNSVSLFQPVISHFLYHLFSTSYFHYHDQSVVTVSWPDRTLMLDAVLPKEGREESGLNKFLDGIDESSNPVLAWYKLKDF